MYAQAADAAAALKAGEVLLLENLRFYAEEEGKPVDVDKEDPAYEEAKKEMESNDNYDGDIRDIISEYFKSIAK